MRRPCPDNISYLAVIPINNPFIAGDLSFNRLAKFMDWHGSPVGLPMNGIQLYMYDAVGVSDLACKCRFPGTTGPHNCYTEHIQLSLNAKFIKANHKCDNRRNSSLCPLRGFPEEEFHISKQNARQHTEEWCLRRSRSWKCPRCKEPWLDQGSFFTFKIRASYSKNQSTKRSFDETELFLSQFLHGPANGSYYSIFSSSSILSAK